MEEEIKSVGDYLEIVKSYRARNVARGHNQDFLFRGQTADLPLISKIGRLESRHDFVETEKLLLQEFKRTNPLLIEAHRPYDDWDYLTLGQHFGLPTRLLDWSNNALTALWFATGKPAPEGMEFKSIVWVLMPDEDDFYLDFEKTHPFEIKETRIFRPRIIKQRINNQLGVFSIQPSVEIQARCALNATDAFRSKLLKINISSSAVCEIREDLNTLGVNAFSIFPELEGLCAYLQWRYFY